MYKECNYRFKGNSCKKCPLGCIGKIDELTRLKQENEELTKLKDEDSFRVTQLAMENARLEKENERLKKDFSSYENDIEDWVSDNSILYQYDDRTPDTLEELQACMESTHEQWQKYKQALEEIKSICQDENDMCTGECGNFNVAQRVLDVVCNLEG